MLFVWNSFVCFALRFRCFCFSSVSLFREYRDLALVVLSPVEIDNTICKGIQCIVLTLCYVLSRIVSVTTLAYYDVACNNLLSTSDFNT